LQDWREQARRALFIGSTCWALYMLNLWTLMPAVAIPEWFSEEARATSINREL
jgi:hypothetical protein